MLKFYANFLGEMKDVTKIVNLFSLLILVATNILSPFTYASDYLIDEFSDNGEEAVMAEVDSYDEEQETEGQETEEETEGQETEEETEEQETEEETEEQET